MSIDKHGAMFSENQIVLYKCPKNFKGCYILKERKFHLTKKENATCVRFKNIKIA